MFVHDWRRHPTLGVMVRVSSPDGRVSYCGPHLDAAKLRGQLATVYAAHRLSQTPSRGPKLRKHMRASTRRVLRQSDQHAHRLTAEAERRWGESSECDPEFSTDT